MKIKEILVLHHSHLDYGYTHTQPIANELHRDFLDLALDLLEQTKNYPEAAKPKWTIEVTFQLTNWLKTTSEKNVLKLKEFIDDGSIGISGLKFNTTPLVNVQSLMKQLEDIRFIRDMFDIEIKTIHQHDVTGMPWSLVDLMIDSGIELLVMGVNRHLAEKAVKRPSVFRWEGPSGRNVLVMNGAHYTMFDQLLYTWDNKIERMEEGLNEYLNHLKKIEYEEDFIYLTTTAAPVCWDNSPPSVDSANLIKKWNALEKKPFIKYITPNELLDKIKSKKLTDYKKYKGDWTDYWNFGCASTAFETKINRKAKIKARSADFINSLNHKDEKFCRIKNQMWDNITLHDEHTWGAYNSLEPDNEFTKIQSSIKDNFAYNAHELSEYLLINQLETLTDNPENYNKQDAIAIVNTTNSERNEYIKIPDVWFMKGKRRSTSLYDWNRSKQQFDKAKLYGPIKTVPFSVKKIELKNLKEAKPSNDLKVGEYQDEKKGRALNILEINTDVEVIKFFENKYYRLEFDPKNCRIIRLYDKQNDWEIIPDDEFFFFQYVQQTTDALYSNDRKAYYDRKLEMEKFDISCWNNDWKNKLNTPSSALSYDLQIEKNYIELSVKFEAPGCKGLTQKYILHSNKDYIEIKLLIDKEEVRTPESINFVTKLNLSKNWECTFDTTSIPTLLDKEQLPGSCRDWVTVDNYISVYDKNHCAVLYCPDAPMVQVGDFNFGKTSNSIQRNQNPLLIAWTMNNLWDTNFRVSQYGFSEYTYYFQTKKKFNSSEIYKSADKLINPLIVHPLLNSKTFDDVKLFESIDDNLKIINIQKAKFEEGIIITLINLESRKIKTELKFHKRKIKDAYFTTSTEEFLSKCEFENSTLKLRVEHRRIKNLFVRLDY